MQGLLHKLACRIGFTETEIKVLLFIILTFCGGYAYTLYEDTVLNKSEKFDYSIPDSIFLSKNLNNVTNSEKNLAYNEEVLDFSKTDFNFTKKVTIKTGEKVNINTAGKNELMKLPGIGEKTADKIIDFRKQNGKFSRAEELMDVKGIGIKKFEKIKELIIIK
ncbi:MAG: ComEA family DNA-binding protein [Ignavibacteriaceae bacterium]